MASDRELKIMRRYLTIFLLAWFVNECANCCAMVSVSLPDNEQIPNQELILPDEGQKSSTSMIVLKDSDLLSYLSIRKISSVSRDLNGQSVGITYSYDQQMNTLKIKDALNREVESYTLDIQDRPEKITNLEGQKMTATYGVEGFVKTIARFDGTGVTRK